VKFYQEQKRENKNPNFLLITRLVTNKVLQTCAVKVLHVILDHTLKM